MIDDSDSILLPRDNTEQENVGETLIHPSYLRTAVRYATLTGPVLKTAYATKRAILTTYAMNLDKIPPIDGTLHYSRLSKTT